MTFRPSHPAIRSRSADDRCYLTALQSAGAKALSNATQLDKILEQLEPKEN